MRDKKENMKKWVLKQIFIMQNVKNVKLKTKKRTRGRGFCFSNKNILQKHKNIKTQKHKNIKT